MFKEQNNYLDLQHTPPPHNPGKKHYNEKESRDLQWFISTAPRELATELSGRQTNTQINAVTLPLRRLLLQNPCWHL